MYRTAISLSFFRIAMVEGPFFHHARRSFRSCSVRDGEKKDTWIAPRQGWSTWARAYQSRGSVHRTISSTTSAGISNTSDSVILLLLSANQKLYFVFPGLFGLCH